MPRLKLPVFALLLAAPAAANAPPPPVAQPAEWSVSMEEDLTLAFGTPDAATISISCPGGLKQLRISAVPAWEVGYGKPDGTTFTGPTDKVTVTFGDKSFAAVQDPAIKDEMNYVLAADADSVTAVMLATNAQIALASDPQQTREGTADTGGAFDMFATTCAQINGLR